MLQNKPSNIIQTIVHPQNEHVVMPQARKYILTPYSSQPSKTKSGSFRELTPSQYKPDDPNLILSMPNIRIICDYCLKNITIICHIACEDYDYCVGCFAQLQEFPQQYLVRSTLLYSLTEPEWLCLDQILLLTAFQKWGFGNWGEVKDYMNFNGTKFSKDEIEDHYDRVFLDSQDLNPKVNADIVQSSKIGLARQAKRFKKFSERRVQKKPLLQLKSEQSIAQPKKPITSKPNILGYNPKRKAFYYDLEYDQKAQTMLADLEFKDDDTPEELQLKLKLIESYNNRLDQRLKRYQFTIEHHILDIDYRFKQEFFVNKYEKEAFLLYRPFTRFKGHEENQEIMKMIARNNCYKSLIQGLKKCRKKIDKQGKIQSTLNYLNSKEDSTEKLGNPRKIYHVEMEPEDGGETVSKELLKKFEESIKKNDQSETPHSLKVIYKSVNNNPNPQAQKLEEPQEKIEWKEKEGDKEKQMKEEKQKEEDKDNSMQD